MRLPALTPETLRVVRTALGVGIISLLPRIAQTVQNMVIAAHFGTGDAVDAYVAALLLPQILIVICAQSFAVALVPAYLKRVEEDGTAAGHELAARALGFGILGMAAVTVLIWALGDPILAVTAHGFPDDKRALALGYLLWLAPVALFQGLAAIGTGLVNAQNRFLLTAVVPVVTPLLIIIVMQTGGVALGLRGVVIATLGGAALEATAVLILMRRAGLPWPRLRGQSGVGLGRLVGQNILHTASMALASGTAVIDQAFASTAVAGSVAVLSYGNKMATGLLALVAFPLATAILPHFSRQAARRDFRALRHDLRRWIWIVIGGAIPVAAILIVLSGPLVRLLFERGHFSGEDTQAVVAVQQAYLLQLPLNLVGLITGRMMAALGHYRAQLTLVALAFVLNALFDWLLLRAIGLPGIALANSAVFVITAPLSFLFLQRTLRAMAPD